jgi:ABC-type nitrate/sulfonate/bicarbonate transport system substrate-binding protein
VDHGDAGARGGAAASAADLELKSLDVFTSRDPQLAVQISSRSKGYFRDEGLDVNVKYLSGGGEIPPGMSGGPSRSRWPRTTTR